jgi:hypothetical protein
MIIVTPRDGLGNQLFMVAAGLVMRDESGRPLVITSGGTPSNPHSKHDYTKSIFRGVSTIDAVPEDAVQKGVGKGAFTAWETSEFCASDDSGHIIINGHCQYGPPLFRHVDMLVSYFKNNLSHAQLPPNRAGVHIRRGDYLQYQDMFPIVPISYYREAMRLVSDRHPSVHFMVFSNDTEWCRAQPEFACCTVVEEADELKSLAMMTACTTAFVCANSTFSWWGAFLGAHAAGGTVVAPKLWFKHDIVQLYDKHWIVL